MLFVDMVKHNSTLHPCSIFHMLWNIWYTPVCHRTLADRLSYHFSKCSKLQFDTYIISPIVLILYIEYRKWNNVLPTAWPESNIRLLNHPIQIWCHQNAHVVITIPAFISILNCTMGSDLELTPVRILIHLISIMINKEPICLQESYIIYATW